MTDYYNGAIMAYDDCATMLEDLENRLPDKLLPMKPGLLNLSNGVRIKINGLKLLSLEGGEA